jgi:regulator of sigma E protease
LLFTILAFVITLGIVIIIHELGHFSVCKWTGIYVRTFSVGFGPKIFKIKYGETEYVISAIPFGGYVKMAGEGVMGEIQDTGTRQARQHPIGTEEGNKEALEQDFDIDKSRHFASRPAWQRLAVVLAGPVFNLVLAFVIYTVMSFSLGEEIISTTVVGNVVSGSPAELGEMRVGDEVVTISDISISSWNELSKTLIEIDPSQPIPYQIKRDGNLLELAITKGDGFLGIEPWLTGVGRVKRDGPAYNAGMMSGDQITSIDGKAVSTFGQIVNLIGSNAGVEVSVEWLRDGNNYSAQMIPEPVEVAPDSMVGLIGIERAHNYKKMGLVSAIGNGFLITKTMTVEIVGAIGLIKEHGLDSVGGPIRVGQVAGDMLRWSFGHLMQFVAFFSINLFLLNLLPIPVLDGGQVVFITYELLFSKKIDQKFQAIATQIGMIMLMLLMMFVIVVDVLKVIPG